VSEVFDKATEKAEEGLTGLGEPKLDQLTSGSVRIPLGGRGIPSAMESKPADVLKEKFDPYSDIHLEQLTSALGYNPLDYVEDPSQIPQFIKSLQEREGLTATKAAQKRWKFKKFDKRGAFMPIGYTKTPTGIQSEMAVPEFLKDFLVGLEGAGGKPIAPEEIFKGLLGPTGGPLLAGVAKAGIKGTMDPTVMRMIIGEDAKLSKKVKKDLDIAKELAESLSSKNILKGQRRDYIYDQTGWFKDPKTGKWQVEVSDSKAYIKPNVNYNKPDLVLKDILHHPELFKIHPELKKHPIRLEPLESSRGSYSGREGGLIRVKPFLDTTIRQRLEDMDQMLHPQYGKYGNKKNIELIDKDEYPGRGKAGMRALLENYGYRTRKEVQSIPAKYLENIFQREVVADYKRLKESYPNYQTNYDWLIAQRKKGGVPNTYQFNKLVKPKKTGTKSREAHRYDAFKELQKIRGTRGITETDYTLVPKSKKDKMWSEDASEELIQDLHFMRGDDQLGRNDLLSQLSGKSEPIDVMDIGGEAGLRYRQRPLSGTYQALVDEMIARSKARYVGRIHPDRFKFIRTENLLKKQEAFTFEKTDFGFQDLPFSFGPESYTRRKAWTLREEGYPRTAGKSAETLETVLHETQHALQHRHGFTPGISPESSQIVAWNEVLKKAVSDLSRTGARLKHINQRGLFRTPRRLSSQKDFPQHMAEESFIVPTKIVHKGKEYNLSKGMELWDDLPLEIKEVLDTHTFYNLIKGNKVGRDSRRSAGEYKGDIPRSTMSADEQYLHERGEAWARNTARRRKLEAQEFPVDVDPEEILELLGKKTGRRPWETLDVRPDLMWDAKLWSEYDIPYPFMPKKKGTGGLSDLGEK